MAERYGYSPSMLLLLTDEQLFGLVPELEQSERKAKAEADMKRQIDAAMSEWARRNPGRPADYQLDILPLAAELESARLTSTKDTPHA